MADSKSKATPCRGVTADGATCQNKTTNPDHWCRSCAGVPGEAAVATGAMAAKPSASDPFSTGGGEPKSVADDNPVEQRQQVIAAAADAGVPLMVWGGAGVGKTATIEAFAESRGAEATVLMGSIYDPSDFGGIPIPSDDNQSYWLATPQWAQNMLDGPDDGVLFLDELTTAPPAVQAAMLRLVHERCVGETQLSEDTVVIAAGNPTEVGGGHDLAAPLANRFAHIEFDADHKQWSQGMTQGWDTVTPRDWNGLIRQPAFTDEADARSVVAQFIAAHPDRFHSLPEDEEAGRGWPSGRAWTMASKMIARHGTKNRGTLRMSLTGLVGEKAADEFLDWADSQGISDTPKVSAALSHPDKVKWADMNPTQQRLLVDAAASVAANPSTPAASRDKAIEVIAAADAAGVKTPHRCAGTRADGQPCQRFTANTNGMCGQCGTRESLVSSGAGDASGAASVEKVPDTAVTHQLLAAAAGGDAGEPMSVMLWGEPGIGKTAMVQAFAESQGLDCEVVIGALRDPTDFGGLPIPDAATHRTTYAPPAWAKRLVEKGEGVLFLDELNTAPPAVQAAMLRVTLDRTVGNLKLPDDVIIICAGNPPDHAVGGGALSAPLSNRLVHLDIKPDDDLWREGTLYGWDGTTPDHRTDVSVITTSDEKAQIAALVTGFTDKHRAEFENMPDDRDEQSRAWPSPRSWSAAARMLTRTGMANPQIAREAVASCVGRSAANQFMAYVTEQDLPSPAAVMADPSTVDWAGERLDRSHVILTSIAAAAADQGEAGFDKALHVAIHVGQNGRKDAGARLARQLLKSRDPSWTSPAMEQLDVFEDLLHDAGKI